MKNWNKIIYKKTLYSLCRYVKMKFEEDRGRNASFQNMFCDQKPKMKYGWVKYLGDYHIYIYIYGNIYICMLFIK